MTRRTLIEKFVARKPTKVTFSGFTNTPDPIYLEPGDTLYAWAVWA